MPTGKCRVF